MSIQKRLVFKIHGFNNVTTGCLKLRGSALDAIVDAALLSVDKCVLALLLVEDNGD